MLWLIILTFILFIIVIVILGYLMLNEPLKENEITEFVKVIIKPKITVRIHDDKKAKKFLMEILMIIFVFIFVGSLPQLLTFLQNA